MGGIRILSYRPNGVWQAETASPAPLASRQYQCWRRLGLGGLYASSCPSLAALTSTSLTKLSLISIARGWRRWSPTHPACRGPRVEASRSLVQRDQPCATRRRCSPTHPACRGPRGEASWGLVQRHQLCAEAVHLCSRITINIIILCIIIHTVIE